MHLACYASLALHRLVVEPAAPSCRGGSDISLILETIIINYKYTDWPRYVRHVHLAFYASLALHRLVKPAAPSPPAAEEVVINIT